MKNFRSIATVLATSLLMVGVSGGVATASLNHAVPAKKAAAKTKTIKTSNRYCSTEWKDLPKSAKYEAPSQYGLKTDELVIGKLKLNVDCSYGHLSGGNLYREMGYGGTVASLNGAVPDNDGDGIYTGYWQQAPGGGPLYYATGYAKKIKGGYIEFSIEHTNKGAVNETVIRYLKDMNGAVHRAAGSGVQFGGDKA